jgi:anti-sigma-K factor RskA
MSGSDTTRDPFLELIEAYALGALDPDERISVAAHLAAGCVECARSLAEARSMVSQLACLAPEAQPSRSLRARLLKTVRGEATTENALPPASAKTIPFWMWAGVAAALLLTLYNLYVDQSTRQAIRRAQASLDQQIELQKKSAQELAAARREAWILTDPASLRIAMPAGKSGLPELHATWHAALGIVISGEKLPAPGGKRTFELWLIPKAAGAKPIPSGYIRPESDGRFHLLVEEPPDRQSDTKLLAVTEEPEGGSEQPTTPPIWVGVVQGD